MNNLELIYNYLKINKKMPIFLLMESGFTKNDIGVCISLDLIKLLDKEYVLIRDTNTFLSILIVLNKYQDALDYLDILYHYTNDNDDIIDYNYYYFLLSYVNPLSNNQKKLVSSLTYEDIQIVNKQRTKYYGQYNGVRRKSIKNRFEEAKVKLENTVKYQKKGPEIQDIVQSRLLNNIINIENEKYNIIYGLLIEKKYEDLLLYMNGIKNNRILSRYEKAFLDLLNDCFSIVEGNNPENTVLKGDNILEAIKYKNYRFALEISDDCEERKNHKTDIEIISLILWDIVYLIDSKEKSMNKKRTLK